MNIIFISGVELGVYALKGLIDTNEFENGDISLKAIYSLDESAAKRTSGFLSFSEIAYNHKVPNHKIATIKDELVISQISDYNPDIIFIIGWSELAPHKLLDVPKLVTNACMRHGKLHGCIGMHPTLLPRGRGRAPIPWALIKGLTNSGVSMFYLEEAADSGDIIDQIEFQISLKDDATSIYHKVSKIHYELMFKNISMLASGNVRPYSQNKDKITYWKRRKPSDGKIDWNKTQIELYNWIRALTKPYPGAFTFLQNNKVIIWKASLYEILSSHYNKVGTIIDISQSGILVQCKNGCLNITLLQNENDIELSGFKFAERYQLQIGDQFQ